jgi:hypothetical protein
MINQFLVRTTHNYANSESLFRSQQTWYVGAKIPSLELRAVVDIHLVGGKHAARTLICNWDTGARCLPNKSLYHNDLLICNVKGIEIAGRTVNSRDSIARGLCNLRISNKYGSVTIDLVLIDPQSVGKRTHDLMDTVNPKKIWKTIYWRVNKCLK